MHDLVYDLAQHVSQDECFKIESGEQKKIPTQTHHLYVAADMFGEYVKKICKLKNLRTIIVFSPFYECLKEADLDALFMDLRKLYIVDLQHIESLPKSVIHLKNLRYLSIVDIKQADAIPESLNKLYQLRVLETNCQIPNVGKLISLQHLTEFYVRKGRGFDLKQLENLNDLFGTLMIHSLQNVERTEGAHQAKLSEKKGLQNLQFYWDHESEDVMRDIEILDGLCPPPQINELVIEGYSGKRLPTWILENNDNIIHLKRLKLADCRGLKSLQRMNELSNLLSLSISHLPRLKRWVPLPLNLTNLELTHCLSLAFALKEDLEMMMETKSTPISQIVTFSNNFKGYNHDPLSVDFQSNYVQEMIKLGDDIDEQASPTVSKDLKKCIEKRLDLICQLKDTYCELSLPPALEKLSIYSCIITDRVLAWSLQALNTLTHLKLEDIITITCITNEVLSSLTSLMFLHIRGCLLLASIGGWDTHSTLESLQIYCCPNLTLKGSVITNSFNTVELTSSCTLTYLHLTGCMLSDDMFYNLVSLEILDVWDCPTKVNPHISNLKSLMNLSFRDCPNLISLRGLNELNHLKELKLIGCQKLESYSYADKLPRLKKLSISKLAQLEQLISRDGFSSLVSLEVSNAVEECFSPVECEVLCYLSALESLRFSGCNMRMLPNLLCLHALRDLDIMFCVNLTSLSELPPSVQNISIIYCNEKFMRSCTNQSDPNWQKISNMQKYIRP